MTLPANTPRLEVRILLGDWTSEPITFNQHDCDQIDDYLIEREGEAKFDRWKDEVERMTIKRAEDAGLIGPTWRQTLPTNKTPGSSAPMKIRFEFNPI